MNCTICSSKTELFSEIQHKKYYLCNNCKAICMDTENLPTNSEEINRYQEHNNDVNDLGYQNFVNPIVSNVLSDFNTTHNGLDFGCGTGPVITKLLRDKNYTVHTFDPFFDNNPEVLKTTYDFIVCCEVIEHFHQPLKEFKLLKSLLKPKGKLYCMTDVHTDTINFDKWYYKDDPTHVIFYQKKTVAWIKNKLNFSKATVNNRLITFEV